MIEVKPYQITNMVATYHLDSRINIALLAKSLQISEHIRKVKIWGLIEKNTNESVLVSESDELQSHVAKKFTNTCEVVLKYNETLLHFRIYSEGKLVITGAANEEIIWGALTMLIGLFPASGKMKYDIDKCHFFQRLREIRNSDIPKKKQRQFFHRLKKRLKTHTPALNAVARLTGTDASFIDKLIEACCISDFDCFQELIWDNPDHRRLFKIYEILSQYYSTDDLANLTDNDVASSEAPEASLSPRTEASPLPVVLSNARSSSFLSGLLSNIDFESSSEMELPFSITQNNFVDRSKLDINNYYSNFSTNLTLDLNQTHHYLNQEPDFTARFGEKDHGVRCKYRSQVDCPVHTNQTFYDLGAEQMFYDLGALPIPSDNSCRKVSGELLDRRTSGAECRCKQVSVSLYKDGKVVISGAQSLAQTIDTHQRLTRFFTDNYKKISSKFLTKNESVADEYLPDMLLNTITGQLYLKKSIRDKSHSERI